MNVLRMARAGLRADLAIALRQSAASGEPARVAGLRVKTNGDFTPVRLAVRPVAVTGATGPEPTLFLVVLQADTSAPAAVTEQPREGPAPEGEELARLRAKLSLHDEHMLAFNAELGHFNEALKSTNEELQSTNEELQSTVEELETSKEELQSVNEELTTVNHELNAKVSDLSRVNNDMSNLLAATGIGMIFVDHQLRIQRFTPTITAVMHLIPSDVGRPLAHVVSNLVDYQSLVGDVQAVLDSLVPREVDVRSTSGVWYSLRIRPYRTLDNVIEGAVIAFVDIDDLRARTNTPADATGSANDRPIRD
ncbi:MAG: PAS domain-containing protein [Myxococcota bacterium]